MNHKIQYLKKNFDELAILGTITKVTLGKFSELSIDDEYVLQALRRYNSNLSAASLEEMGEHFSGMNPDSISGLINNVQGILHEIEWISIENSDGDSVVAGLFEDTNHEDYDIWYFDKDTGEYWIEQLKATKDKSEVRNWIEDHPDGTIRVDEEMAEELDLDTTGLNREELRAKVEDVVDRLKDSAEDDSIWDYFPALTGISVALIVWELHKRYKNGEITDEQFKMLTISATGLKAAKIATIILLLSIPVINVITGTALIYRLIQTGNRLLDN